MPVEEDLPAVVDDLFIVGNDAGRVNAFRLVIWVEVDIILLNVVVPIAVPGVSSNVPGDPLGL